MRAAFASSVIASATLLADRLLRTSISAPMVRSNTLPMMPGAGSSGSTSRYTDGTPGAMLCASRILNSRKPLQPSA